MNVLKLSLKYTSKGPCSWEPLVQLFAPKPNKVVGRAWGFLAHCNTVFVCMTSEVNWLLIENEMIS